VRTIFVTPHADHEQVIKPGRLARDIAQSVSRLRHEVDAANIPLSLLPGAEVMLSPSLPRRLPNEPWLCLGEDVVDGVVQNPSVGGVEPGAKRRHILVEVPLHTPWSAEIDGLLFQIAVQGVTPILAHPERYADIQRDISIARSLAQRGVLLQVTAASLANPDHPTGRSARTIVEEGLAAFVASDAHAAPYTAHFDPVETKALVTSLVGEQSARQVLEDNPRRLLQGAVITVAPRIQVEEKPARLARKVHWWSWFRK
jgi:protein-tyrosine phosphatase